MSDPELDSPESTHKEQNTPGTSRRKKTEEIQDLSSASGKTASISPDEGVTTKKKLDRSKAK
jgi:hypothetical protein